MKLTETLIALLSAFFLSSMPLHDQNSLQWNEHDPHHILSTQLETAKKPLKSHKKPLKGQEFLLSVDPGDQCMFSTLGVQ